MHDRRLQARIGLLSLLVMNGCLQSESSPKARLVVEVAPLLLPDVGDAQYTIVVANAVPQTVWTATVTSDRFGDGVGSISYVGPCDAQQKMHTVTLTLDKLWDSNGDLLESPEDYKNPGPIALRDIECRENADVPVVFNLTIMRAARQGFFDIAVNFQDVFCSAKVDCVEALLHDGDTRGPTVVMGFACSAGSATGGPESTYMYLTDVTLSCVDAIVGGPLPAISETLHIADVIAPGVQGAVTGLLFEWAQYHGKEGFTDFDKCYWNHAFGLDLAAIGARVCTLTGSATASNAPLLGGAIASNTVWPVIDFSVDVVLADGSLCVNHPLDGDPVGVSTSYVTPDTDPCTAPFTAVYRCGEEPAAVLSPCEDDVVPPTVVAPPNTTIACTALPAEFDPSDTTQLQALFGMATATDNCPCVQLEELDPQVNLSCGGTIRRTFRARDRAGLTSSATQIVTVEAQPDYEVRFPADIQVQCGDPITSEPTMTTNACDLLAVNYVDEEFNVVANACRKTVRTWQVIEWCTFDNAFVSVGADEDCDGTRGDEDVWVLRRPDGTVYFDRDDDEGNSSPAAATKSMSCDGSTNPSGHWRNSADVPAIADIGGGWVYQQVITETDDGTDPVLSAPALEPFCSHGSLAEGGTAQIPFTLDEPCAPELSAQIDLNRDGSIDSTALISGAYPDFTVSGNFPYGEHRLAVAAADLCGNAASLDIPFSIVDCKLPTVVCIDGLAVPPLTEVTVADLLQYSEDNVTPSNALVHSLRKGSGPGTGFPLVGSEPVASLSFGCSDVGFPEFELWARDAAGNAAFCRTYVTVQDNDGTCE